MSRQSKVRDNVQLLVNAEPQCKENYNLLVVRYWMKFDGARDFQDVLGCTSSESITRAFRALITSGVVTLDKETKRKRQEQESEFNSEYGYGHRPKQQTLDLDF